MRAVLFGHRFTAPDPTGVGRYSLELARALARLASGPELVLASAAEAGTVPAGVDHLPAAHLRGPRPLALARWGVLARPPIESVTGPVDVVHVLAPFIPVPARSPLVVTVHDLLPLHHPHWYGRRERWGYRKGLAHTARHAARVIAVSERVASEVCAELGVAADRVTVIPEGVAAAFEQRPSRAEREQVCRRYGVVPGRFVIAVGAIDARKNLALLVRALDGLNVPLLLAGTRGDGWTEIESVLRAGARVRVRSPGYVPDGDLGVLVASARLLAHASLDEGFGLPPIEAMAAGTPAVLARAGAMPEVVGDAALWVDPHDVAAWRAAIDRLVRDDELHGRMATRGSDHAATFSWDRAAAMTVDVYREVAPATSRA